MGVAGRPAWRRIPPAASETGALIAAIFWQPLSGGMMIGVGGSRVPKYGRLMACPKNG
jgi:hypothetical protein